MLTPFVLALAAVSLAGFFFIPAICLYLDGRSRTYTGAATVLIATAAAAIFFGPTIAGLFAFVAIATAGVYVLARIKQPFTIGLAGSAAGGVLGAMAFIGILGASLGKPIGEAGAHYFFNAMNTPIGLSPLDYLDAFAAWVKGVQNAEQTSIFSAFINPTPIEIVALPDEEKAKLLLPLMESAIAQTLPGMALVAGLLTGGLGYYLPVFGLQAARHRGKTTAGDAVEVPPFSSFKFPKYVVITIFLFQFIASMGAETSGLATLYMAAMMLFNLTMTVQGLAFLSFLLERKKLGPWLRLVILAPAQLLFFWIMPYVGFFDALFDMRSVITRVDALKAKGKQVFTQDGLEELRRMEQDRKDKKGNDGEDDNQ